MVSYTLQDLKNFYENNKYNIYGIDDTKKLFQALEDIEREFKE